jgi:hypothetical protein
VYINNDLDLPVILDGQFSIITYCIQLHDKSVCIDTFHSNNMWDTTFHSLRYDLFCYVVIPESLFPETELNLIQQELIKHLQPFRYIHNEILCRISYTKAKQLLCRKCSLPEDIIYFVSDGDSLSGF